MTDHVDRFLRSMQIGYEEWHDGVGYDLDALRAASARDRSRIEEHLLARGVQDWRDVDALAELGTDRARAALRDAAMGGGSPEVAQRVLAVAPDVVDQDEAVASVVDALRRATISDGLVATLRVVETFHPPAVVDALFEAARTREAVVAFHCAAMILHVHGFLESVDDPGDARPFLLRFSAPPEMADRMAAFDELRARCGR